MGSTPLIEFAVDGGSRVGYGHVGRCLAIWEQLRDVAVFSGPAELAPYLAQYGAPHVPTGAAQAVVFDQVQPTSEQNIVAVQQEGRRVCLIDDPGPGRAVADLVVDPPTGRTWPAAGGRRLAGFEHALIREDVVRAGLEARERACGIGGILVALGGSDPLALAPAISSALSAAGTQPVVVLGPGYTGPIPVHGRVLRRPPRFAQVLAAAEVLVAGFGHTLLEAAHLGVPSVAAVFVDKHREDARALARHGFMEVVDLTAGASPEDVAAAVSGLNPNRRLAMAEAGRRLLDGRGAQRVAKAIRQLL